MRRDDRPHVWMRHDVPLTAIRALEAFRAEVRPQLAAYGHHISPFRPTYTFDGVRTSAIHSQTRCVVCGLAVVLDCDLASNACHVAPRSASALAPCAGRRVGA